MRIRVHALGLAFLVAVATGAYPASGAGETPAKRLGKTVVGWKDGTVHIVVGYKWANANFESEPWLLFEVGVLATSGKPVTINREDVSLLAPDGTQVYMPGQKRMAAEVPEIRKFVQQAQVMSDPITGYFPAPRVEKPLGFFTIPGENIVFDEVTVDTRVLARGYLFFPGPSGKWPPGTYTLLVKNKDVDVKLPFDMPARKLSKEQKPGDKTVPW